MHNFKIEIYLKLIFLVCLISITSAYFIEYVLGHQPCNLCLIERIPYGLGLILLIFPTYHLFLNFWLGDDFNQTILDLTKIFSISAIFACASHILITQFEALQVLKRNLKFEFILMPFFLISLYYFISNSYSLFYISLVVLAKETMILFFRLNLLKNVIKKISIYYFYSLIFLFMLYLSFANLNLFFLFEILILINIFKK